MNKLGAIPLSADILTKANIGLWAFELDEGKPPRMYADTAMLGLIGLNHQVSPEETYHAWYDHIDDESYGLVSDAVAKMTAGEHAEVQYPWHNPKGQTMIVRCGGVQRQRAQHQTNKSKKKNFTIFHRELVVCKITAAKLQLFFDIRKFICKI